MAFDFKKLTKFSLSKGRLEWLSISLVPLVTFFSIAIITAFVILPRIGAILALRKVIDDKTTKIAKLQKKLDTLQSLRLSDIESDLRITRISLPDQKDAVGAVIGIQKVAAETGVDITAVNTAPGEVSEESKEQKVSPKPQAPEEAGILDVGQGKTQKNQPTQAPFQPVLQQAPQNLIDLNLTIEAKEGGSQNSFEKIRNFLEKLLKARRVFSIKSIALTTNTTTETPSLSLTLSVSAFFQPLPKEIGPIDAPVSAVTSQERQLLSKLAEFEVVSEKIFPKTLGKSNPFRD